MATTNFETILRMKTADCLKLGLQHCIDVVQRGMNNLREDKNKYGRADKLVKRIDVKGVLTDKDRKDRADAIKTVKGLRKRFLLYRRAESKMSQLNKLGTNPVDGANTASASRSVRSGISDSDDEEESGEENGGGAAVDGAVDARKRGNTASAARSVRRRISDSDDEEESGEENGGGGGGDVSLGGLSEDEDEDEVESHAGNDGSSNNGVGVVQPQQQLVGRGANNANSVLGGRRAGREANTEVDGRQEFMDYLKKGQRKMENKKKGWYFWPFF